MPRMGLADIRLECAECGAEVSAEEGRQRCDCGEPLDVRRDLAELSGTVDRELFDGRLASRARWDRSGVWRFRELVLPVPEDVVVTRGEGRTNLHPAPGLAARAGVETLLLKHEGENPTGSFKDRGMTVGVTVAKALGRTRVACASTGNTSASMASYAAAAGMEAIVFVPEGKVTASKLGQALAHGARTLQIDGDFDDSMRLVEQLCVEESIYLLNSLNPFRVEGQKSIAYDLLQDLEWQVPDWVVLPGGNLGNGTALARGFLELRDLGLVPRAPRLAIVQAEGASPFRDAWAARSDLVPVARAETLASAIRIGAPVSWRRCLRGLVATDGVVCAVPDQEIVDAKALVDAAGIGAEPASCATYAGLRRLVADGTIPRGATVCAVLTGHLLKDTDLVADYHASRLASVTATYANPPRSVPRDIAAIRAALDAPSGGSR